MELVFVVEVVEQEIIMGLVLQFGYFGGCKVGKMNMFLKGILIGVLVLLVFFVGVVVFG